MLVVHAEVSYNACMQYTLRNIPINLDNALREKARREGPERFAVLRHIGEAHLALGRIEEAVDCFNKSLEQDPDDGPSRFLAGQARRFQKSPPPQGSGEVFSLDLGLSV